MGASEKDAARAAVILEKAFTAGLTKDENHFFLRVLLEIHGFPSLLECSLWWGAVILSLLVNRDVSIQKHVEA